MSLNLRRIGHESNEPSTCRRGVVKSALRASANEAHDLIERAKEQAGSLIAAAREEADQDRARERQELEQHLWARAASYAGALQAEWMRATAELEERMAGLLVTALRRLADETPSAERVRRCVRALVAEAGTPDGGSLLVGPGAFDDVNAMDGKLPWPVEACDELPPGTVRLVSAHGRWECRIDSVIDRLAAAVAAPTHPEQGVSQ
jgi:flagellar biosynthesis/type III secretory pathway protein FliH